MYSLIEKREYARIELENRRYKKIETPCIARFYFQRHKDNEIFNPEWDIIAVKNLSAEGMLFTCDKNLGIDSILNIKLEISKSLPTIGCEGRIVRIEELQNLSGYFTAMMFTEMSAQKKEEVNVTIEKILRKERGKKNFSFSKIVKMINFINRGKGVAEPLQENFQGLQAAYNNIN